MTYRTLYLLLGVAAILAVAAGHRQLRFYGPVNPGPSYLDIIGDRERAKEAADPDYVNVFEQQRLREIRESEARAAAHPSGRDPKWIPGSNYPRGR